MFLRSMAGQCWQHASSFWRLRAPQCTWWHPSWVLSLRWVQLWHDVSNCMLQAIYMNLKIAENQSLACFYPAVLQQIQGCAHAA